MKNGQRFTRHNTTDNDTTLMPEEACANRVHVQIRIDDAEV